MLVARGFLSTFCKSIGNRPRLTTDASDHYRCAPVTVAPSGGSRRTRVGCLIRLLHLAWLRQVRLERRDELSGNCQNKLTQTDCSVSGEWDCSAAGPPRPRLTPRTTVAALRCPSRRLRRSSNPRRFFLTTRSAKETGPCRARFVWRREWDSNPRWALDPYTLSRRAPSTARPSLLVRPRIISAGERTKKSPRRTAGLSTTSCVDQRARVSTVSPRRLG